MKVNEPCNLNIVTYLVSFPPNFPAKCWVIFATLNTSNNKEKYKRPDIFSYIT